MVNFINELSSRSGELGEMSSYNNHKQRMRFEQPQQRQPYGGASYARPQGAGNIPRLQHPHQQQNQMPQQVAGQPVVRNLSTQQLAGSYVYGPPGAQATMVVYPQGLHAGMSLGPGQQPQYRYQQMPNFIGYNPAHIQYGQLMVQQHQLQAAGSANASYSSPYHAQQAQQNAVQNQIPTHQHPSAYYPAPHMQHQAQYIRAQSMQPVNVPQVQQVAQQPPQAHQGHHVQVHQQQQPNVVQVVQVSHPPQQPEHREPVQHQQQTQYVNPPPRQKRILKIVDPTSGKQVIEEDGEPAVSVSPQPTVEHVGGSNDIVFNAEEVHPSQIVVAAVSTTPNPPPIEESIKPVFEEHAFDQDQDVKKVKKEFYRMITRTADESNNDSRSSSLSTSEAVPPPPSNPNVPTTSTTTGGPVPVLETLAPTPVPVPEAALAVDVSPFVTVPDVPEIPVPAAPATPVITPSHSQTVSPVTVSLESEVMDESTTSEEPVNTSLPEEVISFGTPRNMSNLSAVSGGGGDDLTEASLVSISPTPIEKYVLNDTPEKPSSPALTVESGEPSSVGPSTRESTVSPAFPALQKEDTPEPAAAVLPSSRLEPTTPETSVELPGSTGAEESDSVSKITESMENVTLVSEGPAQKEETLQNGKKEVPAEDNYTEGEEEDLEDGELLDDGEDGGEASEEPDKNRRVVYDRLVLLNLSKSGTKDSTFIQSLPAELVKDGKPSLNSGGLGYGRQGGSPSSGFSRSNMGPQSGGGPRRDGGKGMGGMHSMNRMHMMNAGWMGMGHPMTVPPPAPRGAPKVMELSREEVKLHKAENAWKPSVSKRDRGGGGGGAGGKDNDEPEDEETLIIEDVVKKTRGILNKLTPENFDKLVQKFFTLNLEDKDERIGAVIIVVFEKAIDEPSFSTAYARMVQSVCQRSAETSKKFRKKILDQCQKEFQQGNAEEENIKELEEKLAEAEDDKKPAIQQEIDEKKYASRRRSLGNVRFIGELYKLQMLTPKIMVECVNMLLSTQDEENLECLCKLLTTIGQKLDDHLHENERQTLALLKEKKSPKWNPEPHFMDNTFKKLRDLSVSKALSSRIRFALLDVYELRDSGWKPRRDNNAPKTIDEVRRAAIREDQEEKNQLMKLPPAQAQSRLQPPPQKKATDWNTVQSNKSSRFSQQTKKPAPSENTSGGMPVFAPGGGNWGMNRSGGGMSRDSGPPKPNLPPRFQTRFSALEHEDRVPAPPPSREDIVKQPPPPFRTPSSHSSRESSRPQTPTRDQNQSYNSKPPEVAPAERDIKSEPTADVPESVKNIFQEYMSVKKWEDTMDWIQIRFPGDKVTDFVDELSRQVCEMSKDEQQKTAGSLLKILMKKGLISKAQVIHSLKDGVIVEMPDIEVDVPKVTSYLAVFLVELFSDEEDLSWLVPLGEGIEEDYGTSWADLVTNTINILKLRRSVEAVRHLYKQTNGANRLPIQDVSWIVGESVENVAKEMQKVLKENADISLFLSEHSWDLREDLITKSLIEAVCTVCWSEGGPWDSSLLENVLSQIKVASSGLYPLIWRQAKDFIIRNKIDKIEEEYLWGLMSKYHVITKELMEEKSN